LFFNIFHFSTQKAIKMKPRRFAIVEPLQLLHCYSCYVKNLFTLFLMLLLLSNFSNNIFEFLLSDKFGLFKIWYKMICVIIEQNAKPCFVIIGSRGKLFLLLLLFFYIYIFFSWQPVRIGLTRKMVKQIFILRLFRCKMIFVVK
jgi:hypothetical protein